MTVKAKRRGGQQAYHHGNLREALLEAAQVVLKRDGVVGLQLRAVTREAGVSHTAAKPHFASLDVLRAEVAALGYHRLAGVLEATHELRPARAARVAMARAYVHFAHQHRALFELMFRHELVDMTQPALVTATAHAMRAMVGPTSNEGREEVLSRDAAIRMTAGWAYVHGLAVLLVEKRLRGIQKRSADFSDLLELVEAVLDSVSLRIE